MPASASVEHRTGRSVTILSSQRASEASYSPVMPAHAAQPHGVPIMHARLRSQLASAGGSCLVSPTTPCCIAPACSSQSRHYVTASGIKPSSPSTSLLPHQNTNISITSIHLHLSIHQHSSPVKHNNRQSSWIVQPSSPRCRLLLERLHHALHRSLHRRHGFHRVRAGHLVSLSIPSSSASC